MKKAFKFMAIAAIAFGMSMTVACTDDSENSGNGNGNGGPTENLPTTIDENFDNGIPSTWTIIDADGDGYTWCNVINNTSGVPMDPLPCALSYSYLNGVGALYPDNYLISPKIKIAEGARLTYETEGVDASYYEEHYAVLFGNIEGGQFHATATLLEEDVPSVDVTPHTIDLSALAGQSGCIAFRHFNCTDIYTMKLDNVKVQ
jgi:hypothetical protein